MAYADREIYDVATSNNEEKDREEVKNLSNYFTPR
jgi:hypothetical protein